MLQTKAEDSNENLTTTSAETPATVKFRLPPGVLAILDQGFVSLNSFATMLLIARFCSPHEVSVYALAWSLLNIARVIQERLIGAPYVVLVHQQKRDPISFTGSSLAHQVGFSTIGSIVFLLAFLFFLWQGSEAAGPAGLGTCMLVIALVLPFILLRDHLRILSTAHFRFPVAIALNATALALQITLILALHLTEKLTAMSAFAAMGLASLIPVAAWLIFKPIHFAFSRTLVKSDWVDTIRFSRWLVLARIFPTASSALLPWIIYWAIGSIGAAVFATCMTLANIASLLMTGANNFFQLKTVLAYNTGGSRSMIKSMNASAAFFVMLLSPLLLLLWLRGDWLMLTLFSENYAGHRLLLVLLVLHVLLISFSTIFGNGMSAMDQPRGIFPGEAAYAIVTIAATFLLTESMGITAAGLALCLAGLTSMITSGLCFRALHIRSQHRSTAHNSSELTG